MYKHGARVPLSYCYLMLKEHIYYTCNKLFLMKNIISVYIIYKWA